MTNAILKICKSIELHTGVQMRKLLGSTEMILYESYERRQDGTATLIPNVLTINNVVNYSVRKSIG